MKSETKTTIITRTISEEQPRLVLTFTPEEVKALLAIGGTSHYDRVNLLNKCRGPNNLKEKNEECSNLLANIYFAAKDFNKEPK